MNGMLKAYDDSSLAFFYLSPCNLPVKKSELLTFFMKLRFFNVFILLYMIYNTCCKGKP